MEQQTRHRLAVVLGSLGLLAALPFPEPGVAGLRVALLAALALGLALQTWAVWYRKDWVAPIWFFCFVLGLVMAWKTGFWLNAVLQVVWGLWVRQRVSRGAFAWLFAVLMGAAVPVARAQTPNSAGEVPSQLQGRTLEGLSSCIEVDKIPWVFRKTERQSRLLIRDRVKLTTQPDEALWEIHQVLDKGGEGSFVFRRPLMNGAYEAIVTKGTFYNRIIDTPGSRKIVKVHKYTTMVDRPVLTFVNKAGSSIVFKPGPVGRAQLVLNFKGNSFIPPVTIMGTNCERIGDDGEDPFGNKAIGAGGREFKSNPAAGPATPAGK
jgi:hypothetical protein